MNPNLFSFKNLFSIFVVLAFISSCSKTTNTSSTTSGTNTGGGSGGVTTPPYWSAFPYQGSIMCFMANKLNYWFLGADNGLVVSLDAGKTFDRYYYPAFSSSQVNIVRPGISNEVYELLNNGKLLRTDDNGKTSVDIGANINSSTITYNKFRSVDVMPNGDIWCGVFINQSTGTGTIGIDLEALAKSTDKGVTWTFPAGIKTNNSPVYKVASDSKNNLYCNVSNSGVAKSVDGGKTWNYVYPSSGSYVINDLTVSATDQILVAGDHGLAVSFNSGNSFQAVSLPSELSSSYLENVVADSHVYYYITTKTTLVDHTADYYSNCYYSKDNGVSWINIPNVSAARVIWLQGFDVNGHLLGRYSTATGSGICITN
jgi:photosystem II stability/assembly factor-like uncharacterized protein